MAAVWDVTVLERSQRPSASSLPPADSTLAAAKPRCRQSRKTHTGCRTCRSRRIKCGEELPSCKRCIASGRVCDGYAASIIQYRPSSDSTSPECDSHTKNGTLSSSVNISPLPRQLSPQERVAFGYFSGYLAAQFDLSFESNLWQTRLLQVSHEVPAVLDALLGLSSLCQARMSLQDSHPVSLLADSLVQPALALYTRALGRLSLLIGSTSADDLVSDGVVEAVGWTCLLFASFNLLQGERTYATFHYSMGLRILRQHGLDSQPPVAHAGIPERGACQDVFSLYRQMDSGFGYFRKQPLPVWSGFNFPAEPIDIFKDLLDARSRLDIIVTTIYQLRDEFFRRAAAKLSRDERLLYGNDWDKQNLYQRCKARIVGLHSVGLSDDLQSLQDRLATWSETLSRSGPLSGDIHSVIRLRLKYSYSRSLLATFHSPEACKYDDFCEDNQSLLDLSATYIAAGAGRPSPVDASTKAGPEILVGVYLAGLNCRDPAVRRRAMAMLLDHPHQEFQFNTRLFAAAVNSMMQLEETRAALSRSNMPIEAAQDIPEEARFCEVKLCQNKAESDRPARIIFGRCCSNGEVEIIELQNLS